MSKNVLQTVSDVMSDLNIEYAFGFYKGNPVVYPYFVGEYQESEPMNEDGGCESTIILTGFTRNEWMDLIEAAEKIENTFGYDGDSFMYEDGSASVIAYAGSLVIPKEEADLKSIQINLSIKEWKVKA